MGRKAFRQFTEQPFRNTIEELHHTSPIKSVLDVGCGYGDQIAVLLELDAFDPIFGLERQDTIAEMTKERFASDAKVAIQNVNVLSDEIPSSVDLVTLNYVSFYFDLSEKRALFRKLANALSEKGVVLVCQYFPNIEPIQIALCKRRGDFTFQKRIEMYFGNKALYGEVLLNEALTPFKMAERWETLLGVASEAGLSLRQLTNADPFYYSLFLVFERSR